MDKHTVHLTDFDKLSAQAVEEHLSYRLAKRVKPYHMAIAQKLVNCAPPTGSIALVHKLEGHTVSADYVTSGDDSNGNYLVLIVRNGTICTIMYTRESQLNPEHLRVNLIRRIG